MFASEVANIVGPGEEISDKNTGRTSRAIGCRDGSLAGPGGGTANHDAAGRGSGDKRELCGDGHRRKGSQLDTPAAKSGGGSIDKSGGEDVRSLEAPHLTEHRDSVDTVRVHRRNIPLRTLNPHI